MAINMNELEQLPNRVDILEKSTNLIPSNGIIDFEKNSQYGVDTPMTGNIVVKESNANRAGNVVLVKHNDSTEPTITMNNGTCYRVSTTEYVTGEINYIMLWYISPIEVIYTYSQRQ